MRRMLAYLAIGYLAIVVIAYLSTARLVFLPPPSSYLPGELPIHRVEVGDGDSLAVLHLANPEARYTLLYSHGNAEDLGYLLPLFELLYGAGFGVIGYDYRGYGQSTGGRPTVGKVVEDAEAVYRFAVGELGIPPDQLILHGRSVGSGPTLELATHHRVAGVVIESGFTSIYRVLTRIPLLPFDQFVNIRRIGGLRSPVLVIHGMADGIIVPAHGRALYDRAPEPKESYWVAGAGHNDLVSVAGAGYGVALQRFTDLIDRLGGQRVEEAGM